MKDDGYTLAEALAAMLILGLAMGGLVEGARVIGRMQTPLTTARGEDEVLRRVERGLVDLLRQRAGDDQTLAGDAHGFAFDCAATTCGLSLTQKAGQTNLILKRGEVAQTFSLPQAGNISLVYLARDGRFDHWPQPGSPRALGGVLIVGTSAQGEVPLVVARSWIEHPKTCEFDMIARGCRTSAR